MLIMAVFTLLVAGIVATGFRWAPLLGAVVSLVTLIFVFSQPEDFYVLMDPLPILCSTCLCPWAPLGWSPSSPGSGQPPRTIEGEATRVTFPAGHPWY